MLTLHVEKAKKVVYKLQYWHIFFLMAHSPPIAHQTTIDSLERHYSQKKETKQQIYRLFRMNKQPGS